MAKIARESTVSFPRGFSHHMCVQVLSGRSRLWGFRRTSRGTEPLPAVAKRGQQLRKPGPGVLGTTPVFLQWIVLIYVHSKAHSKIPSAQSLESENLEQFMFLMCFPLIFPRRLQDPLSWFAMKSAYILFKCLFFFRGLISFIFAWAVAWGKIK